MLFVNAHGALDLSATLDAEDWHRVISRFLAILSEGVQRFGGVVDRFTGEGIKARFGAPVADEHHARRACEAALHLARELAGFAAEVRRTSGIGFSVRMGLNSGEALCAPLGGAAGDSYSAQGLTAALAARMEQLAEPGRIYLTEPTAALVRDFFRLRDLGLLPVRGVAGPVRVFELEGPGEHRTRLEAAQARGLARLVGREAELERLEAALERALQSGRPQVVGVVGEAGIGKSRLCEELLRRCQTRGLAVYRESGIERDRDLSFGASRRFLHWLFGILDADPPQAAREKVAGRVLLLDEGLRGSLPIVFDYLGIAEPGATVAQIEVARRLESLATVIKRVIEAPDPRNPTVYVFDDRHFTDPASEAVGETFFRNEIASRTLMVMTYRPGYRPAWAGLADFAELALAPLDGAAMDGLLRDRLGAHPSLAAVAPTIRERSGGNPLFLEELIRALVDSGALAGEPGAYRCSGSTPASDLPPSLRALLAARIDRLAEREKRVLQAASVAGVRFRGDLLLRMADLGAADLAAALETLAALGLVEREAGAPHGGYRFLHVLTQEAAYGSLVLDRRVRLHAAVAGALAEAPRSNDGQAALVALHWDKAGEPLEAARWSRRAAEHATSRDPADARRQWRNARAQASRAAKSRETLALRLAACLGELQLGWHQGIEQGEATWLLEEGRELAARCEDMRSLASLVATFAGVLAMRAPVGAIAFGREACAIADRIGDDDLRLALRSRLALTLYEAGDLAAILDLWDEPCVGGADPSLGASLLGFSPALHIAAVRGVALADLGDLAAGIRTLESTIVAARARGDDAALCMTVSGLAAVSRLVGEVAPGLLELAREVVRIADRSQSRFLRAVAVMALGNAQFYASAPQEAAATLEDAHAIVRAGGISFHVEASLLSTLAVSLVACADSEGAFALAERTLAIVAGRGCRLNELDARLRWAYVAGETGQAAPERIGRELRAARSLIEQTGARSREPMLHSLAARLAQTCGDAPRFRAESAAAIRAARAIGATGHVTKIPTWLAAGDMAPRVYGRT